jgi:hypothetical protein
MRNEVIPRRGEAKGHGTAEFSDAARLGGESQYSAHVITIPEFGSEFSARRDLLGGRWPIKARPIRFRAICRHGENDAAR